jgi:hypothetical protein
MKLSPLLLTSSDVRSFDAIRINSRIIYALNRDRKISIWEWNIEQHKFVAPIELVGDNLLDCERCVNPKFVILPNGQLRLYVTVYLREGVWPLRFADLPIWEHK